MLNNILNKQGGKFSLRIKFLMLIIFSIYSREVYAFAGNIYIDSSITGIPYIIQNSSPVQPNTTILKSANDMPANSNIADPTTNVTVGGRNGTWTRYNIINTSVSTVYVLFVNGGKYNVQGGYALGKDGVVTDSYISGPLTYYTAATPPAPANVSLTLNGLSYPAYDGKVDSAISGLNPSYQATGSIYALYDVAGGSDRETDGTLGVTPIINGNGALGNYTIVGSKGKVYRVRMAYVNYFTNSDYSNVVYGDSKNLLVPSGADVMSTANQTWNFKFNTTGINTVVFPFDLTKPVLDGAVEKRGANNEIKVKQFIEFINSKSTNTKNVSVFGWWDAAAQKHIGLTAIPEDAYDATNGNITNTANIKAVGMTVEEILDHSLIPVAQPYQVTVGNAVDVSLNGTPTTSP
ncbi:MAG: hypothetical protein ABIH50_01145 [bacterium]